ncbi:hypothetical protein, partial [Hoeflea sp. BAL378]|uniref:hypothetical protein n=1 Tax=Hoeflea sp. BAL378 TaxID=1547437 RepID=UPI001AEC452E
AHGGRRDKNSVVNGHDLWLHAPAAAVKMAAGAGHANFPSSESCGLIGQIAEILRRQCRIKIHHLPCPALGV